jgi:hypothetical protein
MVAQELREVYGEDQLTGLVVLRDQVGGVRRRWAKMV